MFGLYMEISTNNFTMLAPYDLWSRIYLHPINVKVRESQKKVKRNGVKCLLDLLMGAPSM